MSDLPGWFECDRARPVAVSVAVIAQSRCRGCLVTRSMLLWLVLLLKDKTYKRWLETGNYQTNQICSGGYYSVLSQLTSVYGQYISVKALSKWIQE